MLALPRLLELLLVLKPILVTRPPTLRIKVRRKPGDISINVLLGTIRAGFEWRKQMFFGFDDTRQGNILELLRGAYKQHGAALCVCLFAFIRFPVPV